MIEETNYTSEQLQQHVDMVCNELLAKNERISVRILIDRLDGKISSTSTASKYLSDWRSRKEAQAKELFETSGFSSELTNAFVAEIRRHAAQADNRAQASIIALHDQLSEVNAELQRQERLHNEYKALANQKEKQIVDLEQQIETDNLIHENELEAQRKDLQHQLEKANAMADVRIADLQSALEAERQKVKSVEDTVEVLRRDLAKATLKVETFDELKMSNAALASLNSDLKDQIADLKAKIAAHAAELDGAKAQILTLSELKSDIAQSAAMLKEESAKLAESNSALKEQVSDLRAQVATYKADLTGRDRIIAMLEEPSAKQSKKG